MTGRSEKRPIVLVSTEGKTREQMKAEAREALRKLLPEPDDSPGDS